MAKISYTGCFGLSPAISAQFTREMCVVARNREKFTKTPDLGRLAVDMKFAIQSISISTDFPWIYIHGFRLSIGYDMSSVSRLFNRNKYIVAQR